MGDTLLKQKIYLLWKYWKLKVSLDDDIIFCLAKNESDVYVTETFKNEYLISIKLLKQHSKNFLIHLNLNTFYCEKYRNFTRFPSVVNFAERHSLRTFPQNFHTRKSGKLRYFSQCLYHIHFGDRALLWYDCYFKLLQCEFFFECFLKEGGREGVTNLSHLPN